MNKKRLGYILLGILGIIAIIGFVLSSPIEQNEDYHIFSDTLTISGIPNFWNVISNIPLSDSWTFRNASAEKNG